MFSDSLTTTINTNFSVLLNLDSGDAQKDLFNVTFSGYFYPPPPPGSGGYALSSGYFSSMLFTHFQQTSSNMGFLNRFEFINSVLNAIPSLSFLKTLPLCKGELSPTSKDLLKPSNFTYIQQEFAQVYPVFNEGLTEDGPVEVIDTRTAMRTFEVSELYFQFNQMQRWGISPLANFFTATYTINLPTSTILRITREDLLLLRREFFSRGFSTEVQLLCLLVEHSTRSYLDRFWWRRRVRRIPITGAFPLYPEGGNSRFNLMHYRPIRELTTRGGDESRFSHLFRVALAFWDSPPRRAVSHLMTIRQIQEGLRATPFNIIGAVCSLFTGIFSLLQEEGYFDTEEAWHNFRREMGWTDEPSPWERAALQPF